MQRIEPDRHNRAFDDQVREFMPAASQLLARRLRDLLRAALRDGAFGKGKLPSEPELMARYRASRDVVRDALDLLRRDGLIERRRGLGTTAVREDYVVSGALPPAGRALDDHLELGRITPRLLHWAWLPAPEVVAAHLDEMAVGGDCLCVEYVLLLDDRPLAVFTNYVRSPEATQMDQSLFRRDFYLLLYSGGVDFAAFDLKVQAASADDYVAAMLHVLPGEPVLLLEQTIRDVSGAAVDYALGTARREMLLRITDIPRVDLTGSLRG